MTKNAPTTHQLLFNFPAKPSFTAANTLPLPEQALAQTALHNLTQNPEQGLVIIGEKDAGKSHLLHVWAETRGFTPPLHRVNTALLKEDIHTLTPTQAQALFHAFNQAKSDALPMVFTSRIPLQQLNLLPDLKSRLLTLPSVTIETLTDASLTQLLLKWANDCQLKLDKPVIDYILTRTERSPTALRTLIANLNTQSLQEKRRVTLPLVRQLLTTA